MSMRAQRDRILRQLGGEAGKVNNGHTFIVKDLEKKPERQYWVPVPGEVISMFVTGGHEWKYVGPANSPAVKDFLAKLDKAQAHIVGEKPKPEVEDFEVSLEVSDLGLGKLPEAMELEMEDLVPVKNKGGRPKKSDEGDEE